jgi:phage shock protein B
MDIDSDNIMGIFAIFIIFGLPTLCVTFLVLYSMRRGKGKKRSSEEAEETKLIQEMYSDLTDLEERIETLETILIERERQRKKEDKQ